jgi:DNA-directed RNA polymerase specialized sigma24 family protein
MNPPERDASYSTETRSNADDVALIRRMSDADETALGALYDRWVRSLYSLVMHLLQDPDETEDVVE